MIDVACGGMTDREAWAPLRELLAEPDPRRPADWAVDSLRFNEAGNHGPFAVAGREFIVEVLNDFGNPLVSDEVLVFGSQTGKTTLLMAGMAWCIEHSPGTTLWVMPSIALARRFSRQRFSRMLRSSPATAPLVPRGADRHTFSALEMLLGGSVFNFVGSNSPANLSSSPCRRVILDEVDKFDLGDRRESDSVTLAEQRTKGQTAPQRWKTSTPTTTDGLIWREYAKGDQRRYFVPCPGCGRDMVLVWSKQFTVMPLTGAEAFIRWDEAARRTDGTWDLDRVERSARVECPGCGRHLSDADKPGMIRAGRWVPTATAGAAGFVSRHLSSLYSVSPETTWGKLAVKFLSVKGTLQGLQGFVNGDLAEPYMGQDTSRERVERITPNADGAPADGWLRLMTVDVQAKTPLFWYVVRAWQAGNSRGVVAGSCNSFEELDAVQTAHGVDAGRVFIDSRFGAKSDLEVYGECARRSKSVQTPNGVFLLGWMPMRGMPLAKRWTDRTTGTRAPWTVVNIDPFVGTSDQGKCKLELLEFNGHEFKELLDSLRRGRTNLEWSVPEAMASEEYWRHMDGEIRRSIPIGRTGRWKTVWDLRSAGWPNHLLDCEVMQVVAAAYLGQIEIPSAR